VRRSSSWSSMGQFYSSDANVGVKILDNAPQDPIRVWHSRPRLCFAGRSQLNAGGAPQHPTMDRRSVRGNYSRWRTA
jgi:hypothetical protein